MSHAEGEGALTATFQVHSGQLEIRYSLRNSSTTPLYVVDAAVIVDPHGNGKVETMRPVPEFVPPDVLVLSDKLHALPPGTLTTVPRSAYTFRVNPGETHTRTAALPLPLRDYRLPKSAPASGVVHCSRLRLELGIIHPGADLMAEEQEIAGTAVWRLNTAAYRQQHVLTVGSTVSQSVPVETVQ